MKEPNKKEKNMKDSLKLLKMAKDNPNQSIQILLS